MISLIERRNSGQVLLAAHSIIGHLSFRQAVINGVVEERLKAFSDIEHFRKKRVDEEAAIKEAEQISNTTEAELVVRAYYFLRTLPLNYSTRIGQTPQRKCLLRSSKTLGPQRMSVVSSKARRGLSRSKKASRVLLWERSRLNLPGQRRLTRPP